MKIHTLSDMRFGGLNIPMADSALMGKEKLMIIKASSFSYHDGIFHCGVSYVAHWNGQLLSSILVFYMLLIFRNGQLRFISHPGIF